MAETRLSSATRMILISASAPTVLIGERINPTGKKKLAAALREGSLELVRSEALGQVAAGAGVLDVNVGVEGIDEVALLPRAVQTVLETVDVPLCIDSANPQALRAALELHRCLAPGAKPLVNSVNGEERSLAQVLPLVKEFGTAVIALTMDQDGIPAEASRRLAIARRIVERAMALGIAREDVIVDCLALTVGADQNAGAVTLEAIARVRQDLGLNMTLGVSNVSFGLPDRDLLNGTFLSLALINGVTCPVVDAAKVRSLVLAADLLLGRDERAMRYLKGFRQRQQKQAKA